MNPELLALGLPIGKYIFASALMGAFYWFLFREKTSFNNCRVYLLSIALVAILISQFKIVVYTPPAKVVEIEAQPIVFSNPQHTGVPVATIQSPVSAVKYAEPNKYLEMLTVPNIALGIYLAVTAVLFILLLIQLFRILALKRNGKQTTKDGFVLVENDEIPTPFSFYKTIFLSPNLTGSKLDMILKHEQWHIRHRHYIDVFLMEVLVRLLWFNPVLWWVRRELSNVSEFHADRSVLDEGQELYSYQSIILEEVMENNPYLANGFNNSFTKKRFIMMKNKFNLRYATLRRALILPFFVGIFSLLCFTTGQGQVKYKAKKISSTNLQAKSIRIDSMAVSVDTVKTVGTNIFSQSTINANLPNNNTINLSAGNLSKEQIDKALNDCSVQTAQALKELDKIIRSNSIPIKNEEISLIFKSLDMNGGGKNIGQFPFSNEFLSSITKEDLKNFQANLFNLKVSVDKLKKENSNQAKIDGFSQQVMSLFQNQLFSKIFSEAMKMSLPKSNSVLRQPKLLSTNYDSNSVTYYYDDGTSKTTEFKKPFTQEQKERKELDDKIWREARRLKSFEFVISDIPFENSNEEKLVSIVKSKLETKVTYAIPIFEKEWWIYLSAGLTIVDKKTKDRYIVRRVENGLPLNQILVVTNSTHKMVEITLIFPPLKESVEMIDILTLTSDFPGIIMGNRGKDTEFRNINIADYSKETVGKVYR